jgi:hypothetical protein
MDKEFLDAVMKSLDVFEREIVSRSKPFFGGTFQKLLIMNFSISTINGLSYSY